jgi:hypothetical protein
MKISTVSPWIGRCLWIAVFVISAMSLPAWSQSIVTCSSNDGGYHTCGIGPNHGVRMVRQRSGSPCVEGQTYGVRGNQVWVNRGCRADFEVRAGGGRGGYVGDHHDNGRYDNGGGGGRVVTCSSDDGHRHACDVGQAEGIRMVRQRSGSPCIEGRTFGYSRGQIWVDRGCRADFEVRGRR